MMAADTMEALGFQRGQYVIKVNNRKVLDGVMEAVGLAGEEHAGQRLTVLRAIDKLDRLGAEGVRQLLGEGRKDESGDFTRGAGLGPESIETIVSYVVGGGETWTWMADPKHLPTGDEWIRWMDTTKTVDPINDDKTGVEVFFDQSALIDRWEKLVGHTPSGADGIKQLREIVASARAGAFGSRRIRVDPSIVRGLEYYTGPVFEAQLTFEVPNEKGEPVVFGSVGGGGRYDGLVGRFRGEDVPATGFSVGVSRLASALKAIGKLGEEAAPGPVVVTVMDRERLADYQRIGGAARGAEQGPPPQRPGRAGRDVSRLLRHEGAAEIRRPAQRARRHHRRLGRIRCRQGADQGPRRRQGAGRGDRRPRDLARGAPRPVRGAPRRPRGGSAKTARAAEAPARPQCLAIVIPLQARTRPSPLQEGRGERAFPLRPCRERRSAEGYPSRPAPRSG